jgi:predicted amidohydrolase
MLQTCFLPECADFVANGPEEFHALSKPLSEHVYVLGLQKLAKELSIYISVGVHEQPEANEPEAKDDDERAFNTHLIIGPDGEIVTKYRKASPPFHENYMSLSVGLGPSP